MAGRAVKSGKLKVGYFAQHQADEFDLTITALAQAKRSMPLAPEEKVRAHLGRFGFSQERSNTKVGSLSGGEKARLLFALMAKEAPNILLLDEPTNHLDIESREALIRALNDYEGAVILVTHDPHLVELVADRLWLVGDGKVAAYDGDLDDYRKLLLEKRRSAKRGNKEERKAMSAAQREAAKRSSADLRASLAPLRRTAEVSRCWTPSLPTPRSIRDPPARLPNYKRPAPRRAPAWPRRSRNGSKPPPRWSRPA
jgi:ATP-binding cassette subfamily F protein 3